MDDFEKASEKSFDVNADDRSSIKSLDLKGFDAVIYNAGASAHATPTSTQNSEIEKGTSFPSGQDADESDAIDPNIVDWDGPNDPENPMHWTLTRKIWMSAMVSFMTFAVSFASSVFSADTASTAKHFGVSEEIMILGLSLYVLGFACGPLLWGPLSELYGRSRPLLFGFFCFAIFNIPVAVATNLETIFVCRFLSACFAGAPIAIGPGVLVDLWEPYPRGIATLMWAATVFSGPTVGPVAGEWIVKNESLGWRWTLWITLIMSMIFFIVSLPTCSETFAPILLQRKAARLRFATKNWALHSKRDEEPIMVGALARKYGIRPIQMLVQEPILMAMTAFMSLVYAIIYLTFVAYPYSFSRVRGWEIGISSLPFLGMLVGYVIGTIIMVVESTIRYQRLLRKHDGVVAPEERLRPMMLGSVVLVIGLFWFGWTSSPHISWVPQVIAGVPIACGILLVFIPGQLYLMDIYTTNAASALAGNAFVRAALACAFPLFGDYMYARLGVDWATSLLAFICIALAPFPVVFYLYGKRMRGWSRFVVEPS